MLGEAIIFSWLTMTKINSSWEGYNERPPQLASTFFFIFSTLIPVTFKHQRNVILWDLPLGCERPLFLNDRWWLGLRAEELGWLTRPRGQSSGLWESQTQGVNSRKGRNACMSSCSVWVTGVRTGIRQGIKASLARSLHLSGFWVWNTVLF